MTHLYIIRHGAYIISDDAWIADPGLSDVGKEQATRLHDRLAATREIAADVLIASTMQRARETAAIIAPALGQPITFDNTVEEWRNADGSVPFEEWFPLLRATPADQRPFFRPYPGGETWSEFMFCACNSLNRITQEHAGKKIALVCHGGIIEASFLFFCKLSTLQNPPFGLDPAHTSLTHWEKVNGLSREIWALEQYNDTLHLHKTGDSYTIPTFATAP